MFSIFNNSQPLGCNSNVYPDILHITQKSVHASKLQCPITLKPFETVIFDWRRKRTGWISISGQGLVCYSLASDLKIFELYDSEVGQTNFFKGDIWPSFCGGSGRGKTKLKQSPQKLHPISSVQRYLRLRNETDSTVSVQAVFLAPSEFPARPAGSFQCSDELINTAWQMGIDSLHLCTQPGDQSFVPVFGPFGNGYVQWDGCRRDREIWGGDLRPGALTWYYNFEDQTPIANSLYIIMSAQHIGCDEHGLFPGSGSTHQVVYEWAFWEVVCLWEYILHTGDQRMLRFAEYTLPPFLKWCEKKFSKNPSGWIQSRNSWMYTIKFQAQVLPGLQAAAALGFQAMENLFSLLQMPQHAKRAFLIRQHIKKRFHDSFWASSLKLYKFLTSSENGQGTRSDLCTNCWAILADIVRPEDRKAILDQIQKLHWTEAGSVNITPVLEENSLHNNCIWPYANSYEVAARFYAGDAAGALELLKRYTQRIKSIGHETLFEMIHIDGSLPIEEDGNTLSFCHAWAAQSSWALQRYLLGASPTKMGWKEFTLKPLSSPLQWLQGKIVTPFGTIDVEIDNKAGTPKGKIVYPSGIICSNQEEMEKQFEFSKK